MTTLSIRRAGVEDAEELVALSAETFTQTFGYIYKPEDLAAFLASAYELEKHKKLLADDAHAVWLLVDSDAADGEKAVGYAVAGPCGLPHEEVQPEDRELKRLYVLDAYQGGGHGSELMTLALEWIGDRTAWLGVYSENHGAQRLYERMGFHKVGEYFFEVGEHRDHEFIFRKERAS